VCVCLCVCERERGGLLEREGERGGEQNRRKGGVTRLGRDANKISEY
jgi:hypothetical protein